MNEDTFRSSLFINHFIQTPGKAIFFVTCLP